MWGRVPRVRPVLLGKAQRRLNVSLASCRMSPPQARASVNSLYEIPIWRNQRVKLPCCVGQTVVASPKKALGQTKPVLRKRNSIKSPRWRLRIWTHFLELTCDFPNDRTHSKSQQEKPPCRIVFCTASILRGCAAQIVVHSLDYYIHLQTTKYTFPICTSPISKY